MTESEAWTEIARAFETPRVRNGDDGIRAGGLCYAVSSLWSKGLGYSDYLSMLTKIRAERDDAVTERGDAWDAFYWPKTQAGDKKRATLAALFAAEAAYEEAEARLPAALAV